MPNQNRNLPVVINPQPLPEGFKFITPYGNDYYKTQAAMAKVMAIAVIGRLPDEWQSQVETT